MPLNAISYNDALRIRAQIEQVSKNLTREHFLRQGRGEGMPYIYTENQQRWFRRIIFQVDQIVSTFPNAESYDSNTTIYSIMETLFWLRQELRDHVQLPNVGDPFEPVAERIDQWEIDRSPHPIYQMLQDLYWPYIGFGIALILNWVFLAFVPMGLWVVIGINTLLGLYALGLLVFKVILKNQAFAVALLKAACMTIMVFSFFLILAPSWVFAIVGIVILVATMVGGKAAQYALPMEPATAEIVALPKPNIMAGEARLQRRIPVLAAWPSDKILQDTLGQNGDGQDVVLDALTFLPIPPDELAVVVRQFRDDNSYMPICQGTYDGLLQGDEGLSYLIDPFHADDVMQAPVSVLLEEGLRQKGRVGEIPPQLEGLADDFVRASPPPSPRAPSRRNSMFGGGARDEGLVVVLGHEGGEMLKEQGLPYVQ